MEKDFLGNKKGSFKVFFICLGVFFWIEFALMFHGAAGPNPQILTGNIAVIELLPLAVLVYGIANLMRALDSRKKSPK